MVVKWAGCVSLGPDAEEARVAPAGGWLGATTMERYGGAFEEAVDGARQQERHYQLLSALQSLVKELPSSFQQRLSYTTLSDLALALLDGTVFEIVQGLLEIQHLTEKSLYNQRLRLQNEHRGSVPLPAAQSPTPPLPPHPHYALCHPLEPRTSSLEPHPQPLAPPRRTHSGGLRSPFLQAGGGDWLPLLFLVTAKARQWPQLSSHPVEAGCCPEICSNV
ncbi:protein DGCR6L isoform X3 [Felis catus]|uniref:protein DGCR6L isoform X3 n=1 Tax=Felis catus TaxID=9685 RepID=UPI001D1A2105|nr:protein DGCR6L isoform X3 [Felis catus]